MAAMGAERGRFDPPVVIVWRFRSVVAGPAVDWVGRRRGTAGTGTTMGRRSFAKLAIIAAMTAPAIVVAGCASTTPVHWTGLNVSRAVAKLGPPTRTTPTGTGSVYVWEKTTSSPRASGVLPMEGGSGHGDLPGVDLLYQRWRFLVDKDETILAWSVRESLDARWVDSQADEPVARVSGLHYHRNTRHALEAMEGGWMMERRSLVGLAIVVAVPVLLAVGCASTKVTDWTGHHIEEVIKEFGPPARTVATSDGGKMYVWEFHRSAPQPSWGGGPGGPSVSTASNNYISTKTFWVRADGIILSWNANDLGGPGPS
jgi:hypothetical protein